MKLSKAQVRACEALATGQASPSRARKSPRLPRKLAAGWAVVLTLPCTVLSPLNSGRRGEHWAVGHKRAKVQTATLDAVVIEARLGKWLYDAPPVVVTWTHQGAAMDTDNLAAAFKHLRDRLAAWFELDDADPRITWKYEQTGGTPGVRVKVCPKV